MRRSIIGACLLAAGCGIDSEPILGGGDDAGLAMFDSGSFRGGPPDAADEQAWQPGVEDEGCAVPADCALEHACRDSVCVPAPGACTTDLECGVGYDYCAVTETCADGVCTRVGACASNDCFPDADCGVGDLLCGLGEQAGCDARCHHTRTCELADEPCVGEGCAEVERRLVRAAPGCDDPSVLWVGLDACPAPEGSLRVQLPAAPPERATFDAEAAAYCDADGCGAVEGVRLRIRDAQTGWITTPAFAGERLAAAYDARDCDCVQNR